MLIAEALGQIGYGEDPQVTKYFKFGSYRDATGYDFTVYLDDLSRGDTFDDADPSRFGQ